MEPLSALYRPSKSAGAGTRVNSPLSVYTTIVKSHQSSIVNVHVYKRKQFVLYTVQYFNALSHLWLWRLFSQWRALISCPLVTQCCTCICLHLTLFMLLKILWACLWRFLYMQVMCMSNQLASINFEIFIFMGFRLSVKLLLIVRNNLWVVGEILIHFVILCFNSLPHYQSMLMQTPEKGGDCVERWLGLEFWWSLRNPSKNLSLTFV